MLKTRKEALEGLHNVTLERSLAKEVELNALLELAQKEPKRVIDSTPSNTMRGAMVGLVAKDVIPRVREEKEFLEMNLRHIGLLLEKL